MKLFYHGIDHYMEKFNSIDKLRSLKHGWVFGIGTISGAGRLRWLEIAFESCYPGDLPLPYIYPTIDGGILLEWYLPNHKISLDIDLESRYGEWRNLNITTNKVVEYNLNLSTNYDWHGLEMCIRNLE